MASREQPIGLRVSYGADEHELKTYEGAYRNLMMLIYDQVFIPCFSECKGFGSVRDTAKPFIRVPVGYEVIC